jgi:hypothetical protein
MSLLFSGSQEEDENCIDWKAFHERDWPGDLIIKMIVKLGENDKTLEIEATLFDEFREQMGSKWLGGKVYNQFGEVQLVRKDKKDLGFT